MNKNYEMNGLDVRNFQPLRQPKKPDGLTDDEWALVQQSRTAKDFVKRGGWIIFHPPQYRHPKAAGK